MAVKKRQLVADPGNQLDLAALAPYVLMLNNEKPNYLPPPQELIKICQDIVRCLARALIDDEILCEALQIFEEFLVRVIARVNSELRSEIITAILDKLHSFISDPQSDASPVTSIILVVFNGTNNDTSLAAARYLVQKGDEDSAGAGLRASLSCLYRWILEWYDTSALSNWVMAYITALEESEKFDLLIEISLDNLVDLFFKIQNTTVVQQSLANVIFHILASLRGSSEALERISPYICSVLENLAADSSQWSRQMLQNVVDITTAMVSQLQQDLKNDSLDVFKFKYSEVISCLERHMVSRCCIFLQKSPWRTDSLCQSTRAHVSSTRKVGLLNLGNTCYMNSVMQALLVTRQFSTHVVLSMSAFAYWAKVGILFAQMMYSVSTKLDPEEIFALIKPPFFSSENQHDSSEFLGYLFELLQSYEHCSDHNFDYTRPPVLTTGRALFTHLQHTRSAASSDAEPSGSGRSLRDRSSSPPAGGSSAGSSNSKKSVVDINIPMKKRFKISESHVRHTSFIDSLFAGILLTRLECVHCRSSSLSRDVFRDLQLAFPEKPKGCQYSVQNLLEYYCSTERLSGDNKYNCRDCGILRDAERRVLIETTPKYLILVLKNFKFEPKLQVQTKLMHQIYYNHTVTLPTVRSQADHSTYNLYAAVIHTGTTLDSGHYYTLAMDNGNWYKFNDDVVTPADEKELQGLNRSSTPYILFYRRTDVDEGAAPIKDDLPLKLLKCVSGQNKQYLNAVVRKVYSNCP